MNVAAVAKPLQPLGFISVCLRSHNQISFYLKLADLPVLDRVICKEWLNFYIE